MALSTIIAVSLPCLILEVLVATLISPGEQGIFEPGFQANVRKVLRSQEHNSLCLSNLSELSTISSSNPHFTSSKRI